MKEVTYKEWVKNPTPRMMWCWDNCEEDKKQRKVIYVCNNPACLCPVATLIKECKYSFYQHCAEIENRRRMTHKELSRWLREKPTREYKRSNRTDIGVNCFYSYIEEDADQEVDECFLIREDDGEWREPLVEIE